MALTQASLSAKIKANLLAATQPDPNGGAPLPMANDDAALQALCDAIAAAVVSEVQTNAVVSPAGAPPLTATDPISGALPIIGTGKVL